MELFVVNIEAKGHQKKELLQTGQVFMKVSFMVLKN